MSRISFDEMCREVFECENYIEWEHEQEISDHGREYHSTMTCVSCTEVGQSYNIDEYPDNCPHKKELDKYIAKREKEIVAFELKCEQEKMWLKLGEDEDNWNKAKMF